MSIGSIGQLPNNVGLSALNQIQGWWDASAINNWGSFPDPQGNFPKPDINFILPANTPIAAILPGVVSGVNQPPNKGLPFPPFGAVVTVKLDTPINDLANHYALLHLQRVTVSVGQRVKIGDVLGYGGGNQTQGSAPAAVGFALYPGDYYGYGPEWDKYIQTPNHVPDARLNPTELINDITGGNGGKYLSNNLINLDSSGSGSGITLNKTVYPLFNPSGNISQLFGLIDDYMNIQNPIPDQGQYNITQWPDWLGYFFQTLIWDSQAIIFRGAIIAIGLYLCFTVINTAMKGSISFGTKKLFTGTANTLGNM